MNTKQEDQIQFSAEKENSRKSKMGSSLVNPSHWLMDRVVR